ncbi:hypothetical protein Tco_0174408 [Tanacetum coccineum]
MDEANLTMEEYIKLKAEKACRRGQTFNWETATYSKFRYHEDIEYFKGFETDFPAIDSMATSSLNSEEMELQQMQLDERELHQKCLALFEKLKKHLEFLHRRLLLWYLEELDKLINERALKYDALRMKEKEVQAIKDFKDGYKTVSQMSLGQRNDADDNIGPSYESDTLTEVPHSSNDTFQNVFAHGIQSHEQRESVPDTYEVNENNSNIISDIPNMDPDRNKEEHDHVDYEQQLAFFASLINNLKCDVEKCNEVNREAQQANALLTNELERYKEKEKHFAKDMIIEFEYCKKINLLNDEISYLKSQACEKDKTFAKENEKYDEYVQPLLNRKNELEKKNQEFLKQINDLDNKVRKAGQNDQTLRMLLPKEDNVNTGKQGLDFENQNDYVNPSLLNKAKELAPCLYNIDEMGKDELSDHKIISNEELKCEAEKHLKVKERKSLLAMLKFEKQTFPKIELNQGDLFRMSFEQSISERVRNRLSKEFEHLVKNVNLQLNCFEKSLIKEMKDDLKYVMSLEYEFDEACLILDIQKFKSYFEKLEKTKVVLERQLDRKIQDSNAEKDQFLKQIASLESKLASQDLISNQKEYSDLRTSYNALKAKFDSLNRDKGKSPISNFSTPKVSVSKKIYMGESSNSFQKKVSQFTTYSLQKDRKFSKKHQVFETPTSQKAFKSIDSRSNTLSWKSCQGGSSKLNLPDHRCQDYQDKDCQGRLLDSFQDDIKYEHVGPKTQDHKKEKYYKDDQVMMKDLKGKVKRKNKDKEKIQIKITSS